MVNYQLREMRKCHGKTMCRSNVSYVIRRKVKKENVNLKVITMIDLVTGCFGLSQYDDKRALSIVDLVEPTW